MLFFELIFVYHVRFRGRLDFMDTPGAETQEGDEDAETGRAGGSTRCEQESWDVLCIML